jgi:HSP20 family protein
MALPTRVSRMAQYDPFELAQREFDGALGRFLTGGNPSDGGTLPAVPFPVDVREDADHFYVDAELPGFTKDEVDITLENQTLTVTAERKEEKKEGDPKKAGGYLLQERRYARFQRSFTLPPTVNEESVQAALKDGLLTVTLNKREEVKPRKIKVG